VRRVAEATIQAFLDRVAAAITVPGPASEWNGGTRGQGGSVPPAAQAPQPAAASAGLTRRRTGRAVLAGFGVYVVADLADRVIQVPQGLGDLLHGGLVGQLDRVLQAEADAEQAVDHPAEQFPAAAGVICRSGGAGQAIRHGSTRRARHGPRAAQRGRRWSAEDRTGASLSTLPSARNRRPPGLICRSMRACGQHQRCAPPGMTGQVRVIRRRPAPGCTASVRAPHLPNACRRRQPISPACPACPRTIGPRA